MDFGNWKLDSMFRLRLPFSYEAEFSPRREKATRDSDVDDGEEDGGCNSEGPQPSPGLNPGWEQLITAAASFKEDPQETGAC